MRKKIKKIALRSGAFSLFLFFLILISLPNLVDLDNYRSLVLAAIQSRVAGKVTGRRLKLYIDREIGVKIVGFSLTDGEQQQIRVEEVKVGFHIWPLLHRQLQVSSVRLVRPLVHLQAVKGKPFGSGLIRRAKMEFPAKPYGTTISTGASPPFTWDNAFRDVRFQIEKGEIVFTDRHFCAEPVTTRLRELDFKLHLFAGSDPAPFTLSAVTVNRGQRLKGVPTAGHLEIKGSLTGLSWPLHWGGIRLDCQVHGQNLDGDQYWPYYRKHVPMRHVGGLVSVDGSYQGNLLGHFISKGSIDLDNADLDYQGIFADRLPIRHLTVSYRFQLVKDYITIDIPEVCIESDDFSLKGNCRLEDVRRGRQGRIRARVSSNQLNLEKIYRYLPIKIMPSQFRKFWQEYDPRGLVQISDAYLDGSYEQIAAIGRQQPLSPTLIGGTLRLSGVSLKSPGLPGNWQNLSGNLAIAGEKIDFSNLHCDMPPFFQQRFNGSLTGWHHEPRLRLEDAFVLTLPDELRLNDDFKATVAGLLGRRLPKLAAAVDDCRQLSGEVAGTLHLDGKLLPKPELTWKLDGSVKGLALRHPDIGRPLTKVSGVFHCSSRLLELQDFSAVIGNSPLTIAGMITDYRDPRKLKLDILLNSPAVHPEDLNIVPRLKIQPAARGDCFSGVPTDRPSSFALKISGFLHDLQSLRVSGQVDMRHLLVTIPELSCKLDNVILVGDCQGRMFNLREFSCRNGSSEVKLSGNFSAEGEQLQVKVTAESDYFAPADFRWQKAVVPAAAADVEMLSAAPLPFRKSLLKLSLQWPQASFADDERDAEESRRDVAPGASPAFNFPENTVFDLEQLSCQRGDSDVSFNGRLRVDSRGDFHGSLRQVSKNFLLTDFFPHLKKKSSLISRLSQYRHYLSGQEISFSSSVGHFVGRSMTIDDMNCRGAVSGNRVAIETLTGSLWSGKGSISGSWNLDQDLFSLMVHLRQIDLAQFNQSLSLYSEKSLPLEGFGLLHADLKWNGKDMERWKRSLNGKVHFSFVKGRLKRFPVLANMASLLNVSQLLTFHLPDLSKGVPYDSLDGGFNLENGVMQTDDLLLKGPAVNISVGGDISLPDRQVDMEVGIQPLQSIDKVIAAVPVVGYIVTGEGKTFIVMRFSVRGPFGKTVVKMIPLRGLAEKTGGILKRLITTPVRVLSWPGKILSSEKKKIPAPSGASGTTGDKKP